ncbi:hypothetical protein THAOC_27852 [Thalassiosira oceanica]|uniref:Uncharacterized protein n=1 Tax=Thalassiosira oceanica TaxID=159749 RepID=K0RKK5_THAOC|nr:hypothetical protein THAOC_27852 [Thalassiosira oceanica]|eukprot:EJK52839.1 hypothetical protein THAOC_27852 [Thalassiosira oceanica]
MSRAGENLWFQERAATNRRGEEKPKSAQQSSRERPPANVDDATQAHDSDSKDTEAILRQTGFNVARWQIQAIGRVQLNSNNPASALGSNSVKCIHVDNVSARPAIEITHRTISRRNDLHQATNVEADDFDLDEEEA